MEIITKELIRNCVFGIKCDKNWKDMEHIRTDENDILAGHQQATL